MPVMLSVISILLAAFLIQTQVRPEQIKNPNQVQLYSTAQPGTYIDPSQISRQTFTAPAGSFQVGGKDWCDGCTCLMTFVGVRLGGIQTTATVNRTYECVVSQP